MGTWGDGIFDNDGARDYVDSILGQLETTIEEILADDDRSLLDEDGESILMPSVKLIHIICKHTRSVPPRLSAIRRWREKYLNIYDDQIDDLSPKPGHKFKRRTVIEDTFQRLEMLAQPWEETAIRLEANEKSGEA